MSLISKEDEIQERLASFHEKLLHKKASIKSELASFRKNFDTACNNHINSGFSREKDWLDSKDIHQEKYIEYEIYCQITEVITDFKDLHGKFPDYQQMYVTIQQIMIQYASNENYELAAILKPWVDRINKAITL